MTSRERFEAWWLRHTSCGLEHTALMAWQARDAEVATLQAEADSWRANARDSGAEARRYKAEVARLVEALHQARDCLIPHGLSGLKGRIDALLREYDGEKRDE